MPHANPNFYDAIVAGISSSQDRWANGALANTTIISIADLIYGAIVDTSANVEAEAQLLQSIVEGLFSTNRLVPSSILAYNDIASAVGSFFQQVRGSLEPISGGGGGFQGNQGNQGDIGTGVQGNQGNQGSGGTGAQGNQGWQGNIGTGVQGWQGSGGTGAQGNQGSTGTSANIRGKLWESGISAEDNPWVAIANGVVTGTGLPRVCAVATSGTHRVMYTDDGITWATATAAEANDWTDVCYGVVAGVGTWVAVAPTGTNRVMWSIDCITWNTATAASALQWKTVCAGIVAGNTLFVAGSFDAGTNSVMTSPDGVNWTTQTTPNENGFECVRWGVLNGIGTFVIVGQTYSANQNVYSSTDGATWTGNGTGIEGGGFNPAHFATVIFSPTRVVVFHGSGARFVYSSDGATWSSPFGVLGVNAAIDFRNGTFGSGLFVVGIASSGGTDTTYLCATSPDGIRWTHRYQCSTRNSSSTMRPCYVSALSMFVGVQDQSASNAATNSRAVFSQ